MSKRLLAAGIVRDLEFDSQYELDGYIKAMQHKLFNFKILDHFARSDGSVVVRILSQYNNSDLIELYE